MYTGLFLSYGGGGANELENECDTFVANSDQLIKSKNIYMEPNFP